MGNLDKEIEKKINKIVKSYVTKDIPIKNIKRYFDRNFKLLLSLLKDIEHKSSDIKVYKKKVKKIFHLVIKDKLYAEKDGNNQVKK